LQLLPERKTSKKVAAVLNPVSTWWKRTDGTFCKSWIYTACQ